jgi:predicted helicase
MGVLTDRAFKEYLEKIQTALVAGNATEHTYRPALKTLVEALVKDIVATNEPKRVKCGAPDFIVMKGNATLGYIETKDLDESLDKVERTEQLSRYLAGLGNLVLTNYLTFRWYVGGEVRLSATLADIGAKQKLREEMGGAQKVGELLNAFLASEAPAVISAKELATRMAAVARLIHDAILLAVREKGGGSLHDQLQGFRKVLIRELTEDQFADMYAQTICYGLFAARCNVADGGRHFTREHAAYDLPKTNPFLRKMFGQIAGPDLDSRIVWAVDDVAELLRRANMEAVLKDFGKQTKREDPVFHFYETFLAAYDPKLREARGVYYTPEPVVSYIVRSVDRILKGKDFGLADGLAHATKIKVTPKGKKFPIETHKVLILDPAVGTGTFLHGVVGHIHESFKKKKGMWSGYVADHLLPRLYGFELLMAPYAVAHMKLGLQLAATGYDFAADERLRVYLTNPLDAPRQSQSDMFASFVAEEANAASAVKSDEPVMVILGNPPYSGHSKNAGKWITGLIEDYKQIDGKSIRLGQGKWLQNDYVKFIRFAQQRIEQTGYGVVAMITDHSYVDSGTFVGMRANLQAHFDDVYVLDLHGNVKRNRNRDDHDKNVFDITQGVAILIAVKRSGGRGRLGQVHTAHIRGSREMKYDFLSKHDVESTSWETGGCRPPYYLFVSAATSHLKEYERLTSIVDIMPGSYRASNVKRSSRAKRIGTGFVSTHDEFAIAYTRDEIESKVERFLATESESKARELFRLCGQDQWNYDKAKLVLTKRAWRDDIRDVLYRPFDVRFTVWDPHVCVHRRLEVHKHLVPGAGNLALCIGQAGNVVGDDEWALAFVSRRPVDFNVFSRGGCAVLPLFLTNESDNSTQIGLLENLGDAGGNRRPNLAPAFTDQLAAALGLPFVVHRRTKTENCFDAGDVFNYIYAVLHSPTYRARYAEFLKVDFPRIPVTSNKALFRALIHVGKKIVALHLMEENGTQPPTFPVSGSDIVESVTYTEPGVTQAQGRVWINDTQFFDGVRPEVWNHLIGGYRICEAWLDRKEHKLTFDELTHYQGIVAAIEEIVEQMSAIDNVIDAHGGWPLQ